MFSWNLVPFLQSFGPVIAYLVIFAFVFAESGLLVGFVLPGDSLLLTAGLLASSGFMNLLILIPLVFIAAVMGDNFGYYLGQRVGPAIFDRPNSRFPYENYLRKARSYYDRWGGIMVAGARFIPYLRTFMPTVGGAVSMHYRTFVVYNLLGALLWSTTVPLAGFMIGYWFGQVPGFGHYYALLLLAGVLVSALLVVITLWKDKLYPSSARLKRRHWRSSKR